MVGESLLRKPSDHDLVYGLDDMLSGRYWISLYPGLALLILIMSINLMGDRVRDVLNPRLER